LGPSALLGALKKRDLARLGTVSGVGKKLAERLGVELSDKVAEMEGIAGEPTETRPSSTEETALRALLALGYSSQHAKLALAKVFQDSKADSHKIEDIIKLALKYL